jgi:RNA recognition motif-containing protein
MRLYVGNLDFRVTDEELRSAFMAYGSVASASVVIDRDTGRSRGFGFVEMPNSAEAEAAIRGLNGSQLRERSLTVNEARDRAERPAGRRRW